MTKQRRLFSPLSHLAIGRFRRFSQLALNHVPEESSQCRHLRDLETVGFKTAEAHKIIQIMELELDHVSQKLADSQDLIRVSATLKEEVDSAASFVNSNKSLLNWNDPLATSMQVIKFSGMTPIKPEVLEKDIQSTGGKLNDEIKQLRADLLLDADLDARRNEEIDKVLDERLQSASNHVQERIHELNSRLERVTRQALTAIGGFIGVLASVLISYTILSSQPSTSN